MNIEYCKTQIQFVDILTNSLKKAKFEDLKELMEMRRLADMD